MKRVCFDTGSNYYYDSRNGWLRDPADARAYFSAKKLRFDCASAFVVGDSMAHDFVNAEAFVEFLADADEIITYNGRKCDLIVLEHAVGATIMESVWQKTHHDLTGWPGNRFGLRATIRELLPSTELDYDSTLEERKVVLIDQGVEAEFTAPKLADTYRDALVLVQLWSLYDASGDVSHTYSNGD